MSVTSLLVAFVIAGIAAGLHALISGAWSWRSFVALWVAFVALLVLPGVVRP
jgi:hypothetical protein